MPNFSNILLFRMMHIENIPHVLQYGITHKTSRNANSNYRDIGDNSIITRRNTFKLNNGRYISDYIPFYFGVRMPMLYVIQKGYNSVNITKAQDIVYVVTSVQNIIDKNLDFIYTDGHAIDAFSQQFLKNDIDNINNIIDYNAIKERYWVVESDLDLKRRKEAEFLVLGDIDTDAVLGYFVYNREAANKLLNFGLNEQQVYIKPHFYF